MGKRVAEHGITAWLHVTNLSRGINVYYFLQNVFLRYFHLENFTICQIFFRQCVHAMNSPNFPAAKVSLHTVVRSCGNQHCIHQSAAVISYQIR